jgi:hypothetical protein
MKRKELKNKMLEGADECGFGRKMVDQMPQGGLPMSCFFNNEGQGFDLSFLNLGFSGAQMKAIKDLAVAGTDYSSQQATDMHLSEAQTEYITRHCLIEGKWNWAAFSPQISVSRSVSKLRFVFAKAMGMTGTEITRIELVDDDGTTPTGVIPVSTFLFPREDDDDPASTIPERVAYEVMSWGSPLLEDTDIKDDNNPLRLRSSSNVDMTAQEYESFLTAWVYEEGKEKPSTQKVIYLRESDQLIKGKIHYKVNGKTADVPATFSMETGSSFLRNHAWTIFAYFTSYGLNIEITTVPWTGTGDNGHHLKK